MMNTNDDDSDDNNYYYYVSGVVGSKHKRTVQDDVARWEKGEIAPVHRGHPC